MGSKDGSVRSAGIPKNKSINANENSSDNKEEQLVCGHKNEMKRKAEQMQQLSFQYNNKIPTKPGTKRHNSVEVESNLFSTNNPIKKRSILQSNSSSVDFAASSQSISISSASPSEKNR